MKNRKPVVHFHSPLNVPAVGVTMIVKPIDHASDRVSNTTHVRTSPVVKVAPNGFDFETENTVYKQVDHVEEP